MISKKEKSLRAANKHLQRGQVDKAIREYEKVLSMDDRDPRIRHKYGELLARKGRAGEAMEEFRWVAAYYEQGGFYPKAIAVYKQMLGMEPDKIDVHLHLGEIYRQQGKRSDAAYHFRTVAGKVEKDGAIEDKIAVYEKLCRINEDDVELRLRLVEQYVDASMATKAIECLNELAAELRARGDSEPLLGVLDRLAGLAEESLPYHREAASIHLTRRSARRALAKLQHCFKIDPQDEQTLMLLGQAFAQLDRKHKALQVYEELIRIYSARNDTQRLREVESLVHEIAPDSRPAPASDDHALAIPLELPEEMEEEALRSVVRGEVFLKYGLADRAMEASNAALRGWPGLFAAHRLSALVLEAGDDSGGAASAVMQMYTVAMDAGDLAVARRCLVETVRLLPDDPSAQERVVAFDDAMGDQLRAFEQQQVLELSDEIKMPMAVDPAGQVSVTGPVGVGQSMDPDVESLDGESVEILPDEHLLSELAMGPSAAQAPGAAESAEDSDEIELEVSDDEATMHSPDRADEVDEPDTIDDEIPLERDSSEADQEFDSLLDEMADVIGHEVGGAAPTEGGPAPAARSASPSLDLGLGYFEVGLYEEALRELETALDGGADPARARLYVGRCQSKLGRHNEAVDQLQQGLTVGGGDEGTELELMFALGEAYQAQGELAVAHETYQEVARRDAGFLSDEVAQRVAALAVELGLAED